MKKKPEKLYLCEDSINCHIDCLHNKKHEYTDNCSYRGNCNAICKPAKERDTMKSPQEKYQNDPHYKACIDMMTNMIIENKYTPSEMREMAVMASINFEMVYAQKQGVVYIPEDVNRALYTLEKWQNDPNVKAKPRPKKGMTLNETLLPNKRSKPFPTRKYNEE